MYLWLFILSWDWGKNSVVYLSRLKRNCNLPLFEGLIYTHDFDVVDAVLCWHMGNKNRRKNPFKVACPQVMWNGFKSNLIGLTINLCLSCSDFKYNHGPISLILLQSVIEISMRMLYAYPGRLNSIFRWDVYWSDLDVCHAMLYQHILNDSLRYIIVIESSLVVKTSSRESQILTFWWGLKKIDD